MALLDPPPAADDDDDDVPLPFPTALPRSDFLAPDFQPAAYLSALPHRHQTLEDLRSELRDRSAAISAELVDLVNSNYSDFLSLGTDLRGGDARVDHLKLGLLAFRRALEDIKAKVAKTRLETDGHGQQWLRLCSAIDQARSMIEMADRLSALEEDLSLDAPLTASDAHHSDDSDSASAEEREEDGNQAADPLLGTPPAKILASAQDCRRIVNLAASLDHQHPFVLPMVDRLSNCRATLLLDLGNALKEARAAGPRAHHRVVRYLEIYRILDAPTDGIEALTA